MSMATWGRVVLGRGWQLCCDLAQAVDGILMAADYGIAGFHLRHARPGGLGSGLHDVGVYKRLAAMRVCSSLTIGFFPASCGCVTSVRRFPVLASGFNSSGGE